MLRIVVLLMILAGTDAQKLMLGRCPKVNVQELFDINLFAGTWYELERYFAIFEVFRDCVAVHYEVQDDGQVLLNNTGLWEGSREPDVQPGFLLPGDGEQAAKLKINVPPVPFNPDYWVVSTDYISYAIVFSCVDFPLLPFSTQFAWVFSRNPAGLPLTTINNIKAQLFTNGISEEPFMSTQQTDCPNRPL